MAEQNRDSSMEEILSSIKRIIAEDKSVAIDRSEPRRPRSTKPALQAVPDISADTQQDDTDEVLELTDELAENTPSSARGVFGDRRSEERLIDDQKLDSMRQSLSALVAIDKVDKLSNIKAAGGTSLEDLTRELMRPMVKQWLDQNLPSLVEELVAREIQRLSDK
ncbi:DUF2497 domain-containing protein [Parasphingorhabdus halotolerans]|uniref:DUF2497 domain-containing protein n=1 Tax=Parasphingorhabdus halotolerans TaxID=2725558 RepID=A0A6H2DNC9_9SPHN|nr:DUF2497 domain-containing protein [Parasphingorhabdus halotolerans]QJB69261.1 DUF2497 domain-containing protein [Parasphingorhabdus halotolerans]